MCSSRVNTSSIDMTLSGTITLYQYGVMEMKEYSTFPKVPNWSLTIKWFRVISKSLILVVSNPSLGILQPCVYGCNCYCVGFCMSVCIFGVSLKINTINHQLSVISLSINTNQLIILFTQTPPLGQDMTQGQFFKRSLPGLNSEFSFS